MKALMAQPDRLIDFAVALALGLWCL